MIELSRGGKDASVLREFSLKEKRFVQDGFALPEAKIDYSWIDRDTLLVGTDFGAGSLTEAGYPRQLKIWKRGTPLAQAKLLFEGEKGDVSVGGTTYFQKSARFTVVLRSKSFFEDEKYLLKENGELKKIPFPNDAQFDGFFKNYALAKLRSEWKRGSKTIPSGSLVALPVEEMEKANWKSFILPARASRSQEWHRLERRST